jgi:hypothetical protein
MHLLRDTCSASPVGVGDKWADNWSWRGVWFVKSHHKDRAFGVVAREVHSNHAESSREVRSPEAIRIVFAAFLKEMAADGVTIIAERGLNTGDPKLRRQTNKRMDMALRYRPTNRMVREVALDGAVVWEIDG